MRRVESIGRAGDRIGMPNHVTNRVKITGPSALDVWLAVEALTDEDGHVDFNRVIPMPDRLGIEASFDEADAAKGKKLFAGQRVDPAVVDRLRENIRETGYAYWYDFCREEWGTKWNAYSHANEPGQSVDRPSLQVEADKALDDGREGAEGFAIAVERDQVKDGGTLVFDTAWSCPVKVFEAFCKQHQAVTVVVEYADDDIGHNCGTIVIKGGESTHTEPDHPEEFAYRVKGWEPDSDEADQ